MPGAICVTLKRVYIPPVGYHSVAHSRGDIHSAGETVFYNSNILHCGTYDSSKKRATLHACMGSTRGGATRARNILQHGLNWMTEDAFRDGLNEQGKAMLDRLIKMKQGAGEVGYSLSN